MSTRVLRSAGPAACFSSTVTAPTPDDEPEPTTCAICLDVLDPDDSNVSRLDCGHYFHATCLVPSLTRDPRCPCCRHFSVDFVHPDELEYRSYESEDDELGYEVDPGPTFKQGIKNARRMAKDDKKIKRSIATIAKWKIERIDARRDCKEIQAKLRPLEDKLEEQVETHSKKLYDAFDLKHADLIKSLHDAQKRVKKARAQYAKSRNRVAEKGGWKNMRCSWRRRRYHSP